MPTFVTLAKTIPKLNDVAMFKIFVEPVKVSRTTNWINDQSLSTHKCICVLGSHLMTWAKKPNYYGYSESSVLLLVKLSCMAYIPRRKKGNNPHQFEHFF